MFNTVPHTHWVPCVHQHKVTSDWNMKLSLGITVLAASENLISSCFWLSHLHFPHSHSCVNKDTGNTGRAREFFLTQKLKHGGAGSWWPRHLTERTWGRSHGFRGSAPVWSLGGKLRPLPRELMRSLMSWGMKQRMEGQERGPVCNLWRPPLSGLLLPCKPHFLKAPQPPTGAVPDEGQAFKALAVWDISDSKQALPKQRQGLPAAFWHQTS